MEVNHIETLLDLMDWEGEITDQMLIEFYERNGLVVTNTWSKKPEIRMCTWKAPGYRKRHQFDYVLVQH